MIRLNSRSRFLSLAVAGALAVGVVGAASVAVADRGDGPAGATQRDRGDGHHLGAITVAKLVQASGLDPQVVREGLNDGHTLAEVFITNGVDPRDVKQEVLAGLRERLDAAIAEEKITAEQAARILNAADSAIDRILSAEDLGGGGGEHRPAILALRHMVQTAAETIGITPRELAAEIKGGSSVADIAEAHNVEPQAVIDALVEEANAAIDRLVEAGKLTPEQGARAKEKALAAITRFVMETGSGRGA